MKECFFDGYTFNGLELVFNGKSSVPLNIDSRWYTITNNGENFILISIRTIISTDFLVQTALTNKYLPHIMKYLSKYDIDVIQPFDI